MADHPIFAADMTEIVESFVAETREIFDELDNGLLQLERSPDDRALIDAIFRAVHTVKGNAGFLALEQLSLLAHHFEGVLNRLRRAEIDFHEAMMDVLFAASDEMKGLFQQVVDRCLVPVDLADLVEQLKAISDGSFGEEKPSAAVPDTGVRAPVPMKAERASWLEASRREAGAAPGVLGHRAAGTIRVEVDRLDRLQDLVGKLALGRDRLLQLAANMAVTGSTEALQHALNETCAQVDNITTALEAAVVRTRVVPIGRLFNRFPRVVRDLAREFDKQVELVVEGAETELDRALVEAISDPLVHLVLNAADHGIETPAVRAAVGKPVQGRMRLAARKEGHAVVIEIEDDGAGIDVEQVKRQARQEGLVTQAQADAMSDVQAYQLLFKPGFSTAQRVRHVSGWGVGLDVVQTNVAQLHGVIDVASRPGEGTRFTLTVPLALPVVQPDERGGLDYAAACCDRGSRSQSRRSRHDPEAHVDPARP